MAGPFLYITQGGVLDFTPSGLTLWTDPCPWLKAATQACLFHHPSRWNLKCSGLYFNQGNQLFLWWGGGVRLEKRMEKEPPLALSDNLLANRAFDFLL